MRGYGAVAFLAAVGMVATGCERWFTAPRGEEEPAIRTDRQAYMVGSGEPDFRYAFDLVAVFHNRLRQTVYLDVCARGVGSAGGHGVEYDNLARVVDLKGRMRATFLPPARAPRSEAPRGFLSKST